MTVSARHKILMGDGTYKAIEDIKEGDQVMHLGPVQVSSDGKMDETQLYKLSALDDGDGFPAV